MKKNNNAPSGSGAFSKQSYILFNRFMFLERSVRNKTTDSNIKTTPDGPTGKMWWDHQWVASRKRRKNKSCWRRSSWHNIASGNQPQTSSTTEPDDDKLFCLSLHKEHLKVPELNRLQPKSKIINVLQKGQQVLYHTQLTSPSTTRPGYKTQHDHTYYSLRASTHFNLHFLINSSQDLLQEWHNANMQNIFQTIPNMTQEHLQYLRFLIELVIPQERYNASMKHTTIQPYTPSPVSTIDSQESECLELFQN